MFSCLPYGLGLQVILVFYASKNFFHCECASLADLFRAWISLYAMFTPYALLFRSVPFFLLTWALSLSL
jgi:hypothetical protein